MQEDVPTKIFFSILLLIVFARSYFENESFDKESCSVRYTHVDMYCSYSREYNIALLLIPKSGSSTGRHLFKHELGGKDVRCKTLHSSTRIIAIVRDPYKRFLSSYDEMFVRQLGKPQGIPKQYNEFMQPFEGFEYKQYEKLFNTQALDDAFATFVDHYDGIQPFDVHLMNQNDAIMKYNVTTFADINTIVENVLQPYVPEKKLKLIRGRAYPRRINVDKIQENTKRKICKLVEKDYCCLDLPITNACSNYIQCIHT